MFRRRDVVELYSVSILIEMDNIPKTNLNHHKRPATTPKPAQADPAQSTIHLSLHRCGKCDGSRDDIIGGSSE